jgi:hypothetical protein
VREAVEHFVDGAPQVRSAVGLGRRADEDDLAGAGRPRTLVAALVRDEAAVDDVLLRERREYVFGVGELRDRCR